MSNVTTDPEQMIRLVTHIEALQKYDFFSEYKELPLSELATKVNELHEDEYCFDIDMDNQFSSAHIRGVDKSRIWCNDLESDVCESNKVYEWVLPTLANISRGKLVVSEVKEEWKSEEGPINVTFKIGSNHHSISPKVSSDWIDLSILESLNEIIKDSGYRYESFANDDQFAEVMVITEEEKREMINLLGWEFYQS